MEDFEKFYNSSLRFLSFRPRSEKEVRDRLKIKYQKSNIKNLTLVIDKVIQKLKEQGFINDEEFTKWWIEQRTKVRPKAIRVITLELKQKGISNEIIESLLSKDVPLEEQVSNDLELANKLIEKRIERLRNSSKQEIYQKLGSYLSRRGFDWETIKQSIDELFSKGV
jgi:regulatory protein